MQELLTGWRDGGTNGSAPRPGSPLGSWWGAWRSELADAPITMKPATAEPTTHPITHRITQIMVTVAFSRHGMDLTMAAGLSSKDRTTTAITAGTMSARNSRDLEPAHF